MYKRQIGDWSQTGTNFAADFRVAFETATLIGENGGVMVYPRSGEPYRAELNGTDLSLIHIYR